MTKSLLVIPAEAGIHSPWIPAFAGMTDKVGSSMWILGIVPDPEPMVGVEDGPDYQIFCRKNVPTNYSFTDYGYLPYLDRNASPA